MASSLATSARNPHWSGSKKPHSSCTGLGALERRFVAGVALVVAVETCTATATETLTDAWTCEPSPEGIVIRCC